MANNGMFTEIYHITDGPAVMYNIDANTALNQWPKEWKSTPWPPVEEVPALTLSGGETPTPVEPQVDPATVDETPVIPLKSGK